MSDAVVLVIGIVLLVAAVGVWGWLAQKRLARRRRVESWPRAKATLVEVTSNAQTVRVQDNRQSYQVHEGRYQFEDTAGRTCEGTIKVSEKLTEGQSIEVMYDPEDPSRNERVAQRTGWADVIIVAAVSAFLLIMGVPAMMIGLGIGG